jgi:hypothetical protein
MQRAPHHARNAWHPKPNSSDEAAEEGVIEELRVVKVIGPQREAREARLPWLRIA